jgi:hypothetical protein
MQTIYENVSPATPGTTNAFQDWNAYLANADKRAAELIESSEGAEPEDRPAVKAKTKLASKEPKVNDKRVAAEGLFRANPTMNNGQIAKLIAAELEITYANAYYYVTRVFKR